jgi:hypothetical protein
MPCNYKIYPPDWKKVRRPRILARAGHRCEKEGCGVENYSVVERVWKDGSVHQTKIVLTIAHLDRDPQNWEVSDDRLRAYCQLHHLSYDSEECAQRRTARATASRKYGRQYQKKQITLDLAPIQ